jgi:hypothetical protein
MVVDEPLHMFGEATDVVIDGKGFMLSVTCAVSLQPFPSVPITLYVVVADGNA